jgi:hypothetical protein
VVPERVRLPPLSLAIDIEVELVGQSDLISLLGCFGLGDERALLCRNTIVTIDLMPSQKLTVKMAPAGGFAVHMRVSDPTAKQ